ncbi:putative FMU domain protein [Mycobacterium xenopi 4042]|uniref:Putative FMU domain protein n=1 Tax=Mycobacterium xenopi 4042 TaxID=1299334 RepID=X7YP80_MYCXE|nr:putative FMU domain protein [Mycobacterium xenopi 4042]
MRCTCRPVTRAVAGGARRLALVQDEGSQLVARALTLAPVDADTGRWLDLCAGQAARPRCCRAGRGSGRG